MSRTLIPLVLNQNQVCPFQLLKVFPNMCPKEQMHTFHFGTVLHMLKCFRFQMSLYHWDSKCMMHPCFAGCVCCVRMNQIWLLRHDQQAQMCTSPKCFLKEM